METVEIRNGVGLDSGYKSRVLVAKYACRLGKAVDEDVVARKRQLIWHNHQRNHAITAIAEAAMRGDTDILTAFGLALDWPRRVEGDNWQLAILVENREHMRELHKLLPNFACQPRVADGTLVTNAVLATDRLIISRAAVEQTMTFLPKVLINAVGGRHALNLDALLKPWHYANSTLIEFDDCFDPNVEATTHARMTQYALKEYQLSGYRIYLRAHRSSN